MAPSDLVAGQVYFMVGYEDEELTRMVIQSYEYLGKQEPSALEPGEQAWRFRPMDPFTHEENVSPYDGEFEFTETNLERLYDLPRLIEHLQRIHRNGPGRAWASDAS